VGGRFVGVPKITMEMLRAVIFVVATYVGLKRARGKKERGRLNFGKKIEVWRKIDN
jgi:hypothetical protein